MASASKIQQDEVEKVERVIEEEDIVKMTKGQLQKLVRSQKHKWPFGTQKKWTVKTNMATMRAALLDGRNGFTTRIPARTLVAKVDDSSREGTPEPSKQDDAAISAGHPTLLASGDEPASAMMYGPQTDDVNEGVQAPLFTLPEDEKSFTTLVNDPSMNDFPQAFLTNSEDLGGGGGTGASPYLHFLPGHENSLGGPSTPVNLSAAHLGGSVDTSQYPAPNNTLTTQSMIGLPVVPSNGATATNPQATVPAPVATTTTLTGAQQRRIRNIEWLQAALTSSPGFPQFRKGQNQQQHNPAAVSSWVFAVNFLEKYAGPVFIDNRFCKIKKVEARLALAVGSTWLFEAEKAVAIIRRYGPGGEHETSDVVSKLEYAEGDPEGSTKLLAWLEEWNDSHSP